VHTLAHHSPVCIPQMHSQTTHCTGHRYTHTAQCAYAQIHTHICTHSPDTHKHALTHTLPAQCTHKHIHNHPITQAHMHTYTLPNAHVHTPIQILAYVHTCTLIHTHTLLTGTLSSAFHPGAGQCSRGLSELRMVIMVSWQHHSGHPG
jgi:hypothetical protein